MVRSVPTGWLTAVAVAVVVTVNGAGIWGIAAARRGVRDEAARLFRVQTEARARAIESGLSATRTDLLFLAGSSAISRLGETRARAGPTGGREWSRLATEAALLVFLRGHPEVKRLAVLAGKDEAVVEAARRGGVPVLWRSAGEGGHLEPDPALGEGTAERGIKGVFAHGGGAEETLRVVAEVDARALLEHGGLAAEGLSCALHDGAGRLLVPARQAADAGGERLSAEAPLRSEGWAAPSPWSLSCVQRGGLDASLEPVAARGRRALALNLVVMMLSVVLGVFAVHQARRRERLEARAREEQRVRELERQLFHAERLGTVGRLAAGLAHELNNPLEGMANYLALARQHLASGDVAAVRDDLDLVRQGVERTAGIVRHVLAQANPKDQPQGPVELGAVLRQTVDFVRTRPEFRGIDFEVALPADPLVVQGRPVMLGQVFLNLLRNACEAQPRGGEVRVSAEREGKEVKVAIADRGPGIPAEERTRIFEPFFSTKSSTGLGLSVCDAIVRQHQGRIEVQERPGGGTLFTLSLPEQGAGAMGPA